MTEQGSKMLALLAAPAEGQGADLATLRALIEEASEVLDPCDVLPEYTALIERTPDGKLLTVQVATPAVTVANVHAVIGVNGPAP